MGLYLILMGVQGAGKGVQAQFIKEAFKIPHVSTGDLFRAMKTREDELAKKVQGIMDAGNLVDDDTTNEIVADRLAQPDAANGVILDGYPRNTAQADFLSKHLAEKGEGVTAVLLLKLDLYVAFKRAFGRVKASDGETYNIYTQNEGLDVKFVDDPDGEFPAKVEATLTATGEVLQRRSDDANAAAVIKRIDTYMDETMPLLDYYRDKGVVIEIDADQSIEAVSEAIREAIELAQV